MSIHNNVTKGSMWDTPKISYSKETGELLKSKLIHQLYALIVILLQTFK